MTSSRLERPTHTTGAHRAARRAPRSAADRTPARHEPHLDGLFTYCLSALCDHDAASATLRDVLAIAERHSGRCPAREPTRKAWLYALARWACLRRLAEQRRERAGAHTGRPAPGERPRVTAATAERRRAELALLAWPEAAGTTPEQRDALELAVRHGLGHREVAAVLGLDTIAARELLATAACEVERTRAALAVVEDGGCPAVARLAGDHRVRLTPALRTELVRHVDDCPRCRRAAERAGAGAPWPGQPRTPDTLPLVPAPRSAVCLSIRRGRRARPAVPRFGPDGFPLDPKDHAARRDRLRARAVTTTVVAAVVAAPLLTLWAAYRGAPLTGEGHGGGRPVTAAENGTGDGTDGSADGYDRYQNTGRSGGKPAPGFTAGSRSPDVSVEVGDPPAAPARPGPRAPGHLVVEARPHGDATLITLRARGGTPVSWSLWTDASWLRPSRTSGVLAPGGSTTVLVSVVPARQPAGPWRARVGVEPAGAVVTIDGQGPRVPPPPRPRPTTAPPTVAPTPVPPSPTPTPSEEQPSPTETAEPPTPDPS
ncbi:RNA polymerase sigma factor [Streptomyces yaizuensis]|uniref:Sigma-70 family RNA polymerase sigma factor n=1 Tax=Streptomyces yaizuensis TaxID=2989713 RepID=A0ABQ5P0H0_9ACTN|nr:hypothetical protein [Streptomyces sp. YSPA8]GLF96109.1 sigma-70 family RNA polymerase sigma factor [Streptomyces sp. YSPA8]